MSSLEQLAVETTDPGFLHVRWMIRRDMPEVVAIEQDDPRPWSETDFLKNLRDRQIIGMVAERTIRPDTHFVVGYVVYELGKSCFGIDKIRAAKEDSTVINTLLSKLESKLSHQRRNRIRLIAPETDMKLIRLLSRRGYKAEGVERNAFDDPAEDGYRMVYRLKEPVFE